MEPARGAGTQEAVDSPLQVTNIQTIDQKSSGMCIRNQTNIIDMVTCSDVWRNNWLLSRSSRTEQYRAQKNVDQMAKNNFGTVDTLRAGQSKLL